MIAHRVARYFRLAEHHTSWRQEMIAGVTTFLTMAYIILVNAEVLSDAGMDRGAVFIVTCLIASLGSLLMGLWSRLPIAVAPGMAINVYFAYVIVQGMGFNWQSAMGAVFIASCAFVLISMTRVREWIVSAIPESLNAAITVGLGLFIALIALKSAGIVSLSPKGFMELGSLDVQVFFFSIGFLLVVVLDFYKIPGAILIGILSTTVISMVCGSGIFHGIFSYPPSLKPTFMAMRFDHLDNLRGISVIFSILFVSVFDCTGTLVGLVQHTKVVEHDRSVSQISRGLLANSVTAVVGAVLGTSSPSPYLESAAGIRAGGRTGLTPCVVSILFLCAVFFSPLASTIPSFATAPALLFVACVMLRSVMDIPWGDLTESIPAALTLLMIPFTLSIANGIGLGIISYTLIKMLTRQVAALNVTLIILSLLFVFYFIMQSTVMS